MSRLLEPSRCRRTNSCRRCMSTLCALTLFSQTRSVLEGLSWRLSLPGFLGRGSLRRQVDLLGRTTLDPLGRTRVDPNGRPTGGSITPVCHTQGGARTWGLLKKAVRWRGFQEAA